MDGGEAMAAANGAMERDEENATGSALTCQTEEAIAPEVIDVDESDDSSWTMNKKAKLQTSESNEELENIQKEVAIVSPCTSSDKRVPSSTPRSDKSQHKDGQEGRKKSPSREKNDNRLKGKDTKRVKRSFGLKNVIENKSPNEPVHVEEVAVDGETIARVPFGVKEDGLWPSHWISYWSAFENFVDFIATIHSVCKTTVQCESRVFAAHAFAKAFPGQEYRHRTPERGYFTCTHKVRTGNCPYRIYFGYNYHLNHYVIQQNATRLIHCHDIISAQFKIPPSICDSISREDLLSSGKDLIKWPENWSFEWNKYEEMQHFLAFLQTTMCWSMARESKNFTSDLFIKAFPGEPLDLRRVQRGFFYCTSSQGYKSPPLKQQCLNCPFRIHFAFDMEKRVYYINKDLTRLQHLHTPDNNKPKVEIKTIPKAKAIVAKPKEKKPKKAAVLPQDMSSSEEEDAEISEYDEVESCEADEEDRYKTLLREFKEICKKAESNTLYYQYAKVVLSNLNAPEDQAFQDDEEDQEVVALHTRKRKAPSSLRHVG